MGFQNDFPLFLSIVFRNQFTSNTFWISPMPTIIKYCFIFLHCFVQTTNFWAQNLLENGNFEKLTTCPKSLSELTVFNWNNTVETATADVFSLCIHKTALSHPAILNLQPYEGQTYVGIKPAIKDNAYREYISSKMQRMKRGHKYRITIAIAIPVESDYRVNHLDILFSDFTITGESELIPIIDEPSISFDLSNIDTLSKWKKYSVIYEAEGGENNICIGNFQKLKRKDLIKIHERGAMSPKLFKGFAYTCLDDIQIVDLSATTPVVKETNNVETVKTAKIDLPKPLVLDNLLFETASYRLLDNEIPELDELANFLQKEQQFTIRIEGHTDNIGNENTNQILSENRALSVKDYLIQKGIDEKRMTCKGFGASQPISSNQTAEGRAKNRRVVIQFE